MATFNELFRFVREVDSAIKNQAAWACWNAAKGIFQEPDSVPDHTARIAYAKTLLADGGAGQVMKQIVRMTLIVLAKTGPYTDTEVNTAVGQIIDKVAITGA